MNFPGRADDHGQVGAARQNRRLLDVMPRADRLSIYGKDFVTRLNAELGLRRPWVHVADDGRADLDGNPDSPEKDRR